MEVDARDQSLRDSVHRRIEEARLEENLAATSDARGNLAEAREHAKSLQAELSYTQGALNRANERTVMAEIHRDEVLKQMSSLEEIRQERDEAVSQRDEAWHQHESLRQIVRGFRPAITPLWPKEMRPWLE